jgi:hypothetical protein
MATKIQLRRDTTTNWSGNNPVLSSGEIGYDTLLKKFKIGDGTTAWNSLSFAAIPENRIGAANGVAPLDGGSKIPSQYLPNDIGSQTFEDITGLSVGSAQNGLLLGVVNSILAWIDPASFLSSGGSSSITISSTAPTGSSPGDLWWNSTNGDLFLRYFDGDSSQWVGINKDLARIASGEFPPTNAVDGNLWWNTFNSRLYVYHNDGDSGQWIDINTPPVANISTNLPTTGWSGAGPFSKNITVNGILSTDRPIIDIDTKNITYQNIDAAQQFWSTIYLADTGDNQITFYATEAPSIVFNIPILIKVVK